jgi:hypothetical protein
MRKSLFFYFILCSIKIFFLPLQIVITYNKNLLKNKSHIYEEKNLNS